MLTLRLVCRCALSDGVPRRSFFVALVVGTVLNLINQGDALLGAAPINWLKVILTYFVPALCRASAGPQCYNRRQLSDAWRAIGHGCEPREAEWN
jgi:hypothetical protein